MPRRSAFRRMPLAALCTLATLFVGSPAAAQVSPLLTPGGDGVVIDFDFDPDGNTLVEDTEILDHYQALGVRFRDELSAFAVASGDSPGEVEADDEALSLPNALEVEQGSAFVLFAEPVRTVGAFVLADDSEQQISLTAYDLALAPLGTVSVLATEEVFTYVGLASAEPVYAVRFFTDSAGGLEDMALFSTSHSDGEYSAFASSGPDDEESSEDDKSSDDESSDDDSDSDDEDDSVCRPEDDAEEKSEEFYLDDLDFTLFEDDGTGGGTGGDMGE